MKRNIFFTAISLLLLLLTSSCDKSDDKAVSGDVVLSDMTFMAQFEYTMNTYIDIQVSWFDELGLYHTASPVANDAPTGNRHFSNVNIECEYFDFPVEFQASISYKLRDNVEIPEEGIDIILFSSAIVFNTYDNGSQQKTTKDGFSYTRLKVLPDELEDEIEYLNEHYSLANVIIKNNGNVTIE